MQKIKEIPLLGETIIQYSEIKQMKELAHKYVKAILYIYSTCVKKAKGI